MQTPDTQPCAYYVTATDSGRYVRLLGPFFNDHAGALAMVDQVREVAIDLDPRAHWYAFGTARIPGDDSVPIRYGSLNRHFDLPH